MARTTGNASDLITFTRASTGTFLGSNGLLQTATTNTPRVEYDANGVAKGLLIEEARTNQFLYSNDLTNAVWGVISATASTSSEVAPDGTTTATLLTATGSGAMFVRGSLSGGTQYAFSFFAKNSSSGWVGCSNAGFFASFDIQNGAVGTVGDGTASIQNYGNGWYRCSWVPADTSFNTAFRIRLAAGDNDFATTNETGHFFGPQAETGTFPTSYIPTSGATATRSADIASVSVSEFGYNQAQGSVVVEQSIFQTAGNSVAWQIDDGSQSDRYVFNSYNGNTAVIVSNAAQASLTHTGQSADVVYKHGFAWASNDFVSTYDGGAIQSDTSGSLPTVTTVRLGKDAGTSPLNGHIKSINYYPLRLSDAKLQELTS